MIEEEMELASMSVAASLGLLLLLLSLSVMWRKQAASKLNLPPGPPPLPLIGNFHQLGKIAHQSLYAMAKQYGPILSLSFGPVPVVIASSAEAAYQFLHVHDQNFSNRPFCIAAKILGYGPIAITHAHHNRADLKKLLTVHLLSAKRVEEGRPVRAEEEELLVRCLMEDYEQRREVNVFDQVSKCNMNIATRLVINRRLSAEDAVKFPAMVHRLTGFLGALLIGDFVPAFAFLDYVAGTIARINKLHKQLDEFLQRTIETYREGKKLQPAAAAPTSSDILDTLLCMSSPDSEAKLETGPIDDTLIKGMMLDILVAGFRTSSITIHWAMAELLRHPAVMKKAQQELDEVVGRDRIVRESDLHNLPYFHAVVKETFRLHPPTPLLVAHESSESCEVNGYHLPKKTRLYINAWAIGRDPLVWKDPLKFDPERFVKNSHIDVRGHNFELIPFGSGRRACPGTSMGLISVHLTLATLLHAFDWALPRGQFPDEVDMREGPGLGLMKATPVTALPTPRLSKHLYP